MRPEVDALFFFRYTSGMTVVLLLILGVLAPATAPTQADAAPEMINVQRIWDKANHNAFTDLLRGEEGWYCVFREGNGHVSPDGAIRVLYRPDDAEDDKWQSVALLSRDGVDLRDPKLTRHPDGRLMLLAADVRRKGAARLIRQSVAFFSKDGREWSEPTPVGEPDVWLWRVTWHDGIARGVGYGTGEGDNTTTLYESEDGVEFKPLVDPLVEATADGRPNEGTIRYRERDEAAICLLRRDGGPAGGLVGISRAPYTEWTWKDLGARIGGPDFIELPDGRWIAAVRLYDGGARTSLCWLDPEEGTLEEFLKLPSGGDTSYAGLELHEGQLWISYYASHEGKTAIYLARVKI